jgi:hypothetical protein
MFSNTHVDGCRCRYVNPTGVQKDADWVKADYADRPVLEV